eukprot:jgi/Botrbrau1/1955/Bobra.0005s0046.1
MMVLEEALESVSESPAWVLTGVASAVICALPYGISQYITPYFSRTYRKLRHMDRIDWDSRYGSTFHALSICTLAACLILFSEVFQEDASLAGKEREPLVLRTSWWTNAALGVSLGYFVVDMCVVVWNVPLLGGPEMVVHHTAALLSAFTAAYLGQGHMYALLLLFTECTTPFLNVRWYLDKLGMRFSTAYTVNGVMMTACWFFGRIVLFLWFFQHLWGHRGELGHLSPPALLLLAVVPPLLFGLNVWWFSKIMRGLFKLLGGKLAKGEALGFRDEAPQFQKRIESRDQAFEARQTQREAARQARRSQDASTVIHAGGRKERAAPLPNGFIADVATGSEAPRRKRRNSLLSG